MQPFYLEIDGKKEKIDRCPIRLIESSSLRLMRYYEYYKKGFLPSNGGIDNQSEKILTAFEIIENEIERIKETDARSKPKRV